MEKWEMLLEAAGRNLFVQQGHPLGSHTETTLPPPALSINPGPEFHPVPPFMEREQGQPELLVQSSIQSTQPIPQ